MTTNHTCTRFVSGSLTAAFLATIVAGASAQLTPLYETPIPNIGFAQIVDIETDATGNAYVLINSLNNQNNYGVVLVGLTPTGSIAWTWTLDGDQHDFAGGLALDAAGNYHVVGWTGSDNLPLVNPIQATSTTPQYDAFMFKLNAADRSTIYGTLLGGVYSEEAHDVAINANGEALVVGSTKSVDFPVTADALQDELAGYPFWAWSDGFLVRIATDGSSLLYSSFLGGYYDDSARAIALDAAGNIHIAGDTESDDFPAVNPTQPAFGGGATDAFVSILSPDATSLQFSSWVGGEDQETVDGLDLDNAGGIYLTGDTRSAVFPTTLGVLQEQYAGPLRGCEVPFGADHNCEDAYIVKLAAAGADVEYSTYLGGTSIDESRGIAVDTAGRAYVTGYTSSPDLTGFAGDTSYSMFVAALDSTGTSLAVTDRFAAISPAVQEIALGTNGDLFLAGPQNATSMLAVTRFANPMPEQTCAGDSDCDGDIDFDDIGYFVAAIGNNEVAWHNRHMVREGVEPSCSFMTNDTDFDGDVDFDDISPFVNSIGSACPSN
jgi:hypothetical protein